MASKHENVFPIVTLRYRKGDLIIKKGDYGISIYKIIKGKVSILQESEGDEVSLTILGPGEIFGETAFLNKAREIRSASVRAIEDAVLEVWHPLMLSQEYKEMPPLLKHVTDQVSARLLRMNKLVAQMTIQGQKRSTTIKKSGSWSSQQRRYYRKEVDLYCDYRPIGLSSKGNLCGRIVDMSQNGLKVEIVTQNTTSFSHIAGDMFVVTTVLPNGKSVELEATIVSLTKSDTHGMLFLGMSITELSAGAKQLLGFFLMP